MSHDDAPTAAGRPDQEAGSAAAATSGSTGTPSQDADTTTMRSSLTTPGTLTSIGYGVADGSSAPASSSPKTSSTSDGRSRPSTRHWRQPTSVRAFAAQANAVATMVLNGEMDLESARVYSAVARTVAQSMSTEVTRSRFLQTEPDLDIPTDEVFEEE